jgi:hypothetical protein
MARAALVVHCDGRHPSRIAHWSAIGGVLRPRAVTRFALHARVRDPDAAIRRDSHGAGRVALKAAQNRRAWIENAIPLAERVRVARRQVELSDRRIPAQAVLQIVLFVHAADGRHGLLARPELPAIGRVGTRQRSRVGAPAMLGELRRMTGLARRRTHNLGHQQRDDRSYQINRPLYWI